MNNIHVLHLFVGFLLLVGSFAWWLCPTRRYWHELSHYFMLCILGHKDNARAITVNGARKNETKEAFGLLIVFIKNCYDRKGRSATFQWKITNVSIWKQKLVTFAGIVYDILTILPFGASFSVLLYGADGIKTVLPIIGIPVLFVIDQALDRTKSSDTYRVLHK